MLFICPTPIGNLGDITLRVLEVLRDCDLVAAEDTRRSLKLLSHFGISKPLVSFYEHNELKRIPDLIEQLRAGRKIALVSDAGMPGISDPGYRLIKAALEEGLPVEVLPGPSSIETALVSSGFATDAFVFIGYLPRKSGELKAALAGIAADTRSTVAFESPHRLRSTLKAAAKELGDQRLAICRELTKIYQEVKRGSAAELLDSLPEKVKGEIVLVFEGSANAPESQAVATGQRELEATLRLLLDAGLSPRSAADLAAQLTGAPKNRAYKLALELKSGTPTDSS